MLASYLKKILAARVYDVAIETPLHEAPLLSERFNNTIYLKREDLQPVFSFKLRGAYNKMASFSPEQLKKGVIASSAGNHAQGLALSAQKMGVKAIIVMPKTTPLIKVEAVKRRGAKVVLFGDTYDEAFTHAKQMAEEKDLTFVHPYDDKDVIAGQGTIGIEVLQQAPENLEAIFVPVGGGGLIAGIAAYVKAVKPEVKIIGVEPDEAACLQAALKANRRVKLPQVGIFADGVAVAQIGKEPFKVIKETVDEVITVSVDEICAAVKDIFDDTRSIAEPAGATALAGLKKYVAANNITGKHLVAIESGANINFDRLRHIAERTEIGEQREAVLAVTIPEKPGSFKAFCNVLGKYNITEFNYRYSDNNEAQIFVGVQIASRSNERGILVANLREKGYPVLDMTDNEVAKLHTRHMVGGRAYPKNERVFRFEFPERPGALMKFLNHLGQQWNISLFHYRNHGAAYGRVLVGLQIPINEKAAFNTFVKDLNYRFFEETDNPAYLQFMR